MLSDFTQTHSSRLKFSVISLSCQGRKHARVKVFSNNTEFSILKIVWPIYLYRENNGFSICNVCVLAPLGMYTAFYKIIFQTYICK